MTETFTIHGVPKSIATDGWWLDDPAGAEPRDIPKRPFPLLAGPLSLLMLILLADVLFWRHALGLSLALYAWAVFGVVAITRRKAGVWPLVLMVLGSLPVIEHVQGLSVLFQLAALLTAVIWIRLPEGGLAVSLTAALRLLGRLPFHGLVRAIQVIRGLASVRPSSGLVRDGLRAWAFPMGGTAVFAALLMDANPVLARLVSFDLDPGDLVPRGLFWLGVGLLLWPLVEGTEPSTQLFRPLPSAPIWPSTGR